MEVCTLSFSSLTLIRALVICSVKARLSVLVLGSLDILCRKPITSGKVQLSKSGSLQSIKEVVISSYSFILLSVMRVLTSSQVWGGCGFFSNQRSDSFPGRPCQGHSSPL